MKKDYYYVRITDRDNENHYFTIYCRGCKEASKIAMRILRQTTNFVDSDAIEVIVTKD